MDRNTWIGLTAAVLCLAFVFITRETGGEDTSALEKATMEIHDEAMQEMADMNRLGRLLKQELPGLDSLSPRRDSVLRVLKQMQDAEEGMYAWMRDYKPPGEMPAGKAKEYLSDQKEKIKQNYLDMQAAHEAGAMMLPH